VQPFLQGAGGSSQPQVKKQNNNNNNKKKQDKACHWWLTPVILATQEAEIKVRSQSGQIVRETLSQKNLLQKRAGGLAQSVGLEFNPWCQKKKKKKTR
jgi:hypothetical protein